MATVDGQLLRSKGHLRTFLLSRSFFIGSQRYASVWTGDNAAEWSHLKQSIPMLLSISVAGIPSVGADVGGFFKDPDGQLITRWYQAGAFQPFFRVAFIQIFDNFYFFRLTAILKQKEGSRGYFLNVRRMPCVRQLSHVTFSFHIGSLLFKFKNILYFRYTLFYEHTKTGAPPMRPVWSEFPQDEAAFDEEREWMVGSGILVRPVVEPDVPHVSLYLPGMSQSW